MNKGNLITTLIILIMLCAATFASSDESVPVTQQPSAAALPIPDTKEPKIPDYERKFVPNCETNFMLCKTEEINNPSEWLKKSLEIDAAEGFSGIESFKDGKLKLKGENALEIDLSDDGMKNSLKGATAQKDGSIRLADGTIIGKLPYVQNNIAGTVSFDKEKKAIVCNDCNIKIDKSNSDKQTSMTPILVTSGRINDMPITNVELVKGGLRLKENSQINGESISSQDNAIVSIQNNVEGYSFLKNELKDDGQYGTITQTKKVTYSQDEQTIVSKYQGNVDFAILSNAKKTHPDETYVFAYAGANVETRVIPSVGCNQRDDKADMCKEVVFRAAIDAGAKTPTRICTSTYDQCDKGYDDASGNQITPKNTISIGRGGNGEPWMKVIDRSEMNLKFSFGGQTENSGKEYVGSFFGNEEYPWRIGKELKAEQPASSSTESTTPETRAAKTPEEQKQAGKEFVTPQDIPQQQTPAASTIRIDWGGDADAEYYGKGSDYKKIDTCPVKGKCENEDKIYENTQGKSCAYDYGATSCNRYWIIDKDGNPYYFEKGARKKYTGDFEAAAGDEILSSKEQTTVQTGNTNPTKSNSKSEKVKKDVTETKPITDKEITAEQKKQIAQMSRDLMMSPTIRSPVTQLTIGPNNFEATTSIRDPKNLHLDQKTYVCTYGGQNVKFNEVGLSNFKKNRAFADIDFNKICRMM